MPLPSFLIINKKLTIPLGEVEFRFARSGGPGGQNVNKVETKVELLFDVKHSPSLTNEQRTVILEQCKQKIDRVGVLKISVQESRSQGRNRETAVERFIKLLQHVLKPKKKRIATTTPTSVKEKRLQQKKRRGEIKKMRKMTEDV